MRIDDVLYFAPGVTFSDLDLNSRALPRQLRDRIDGFYLAPARECVRRQEPFAAGVLLVCAIDALARMMIGGNDVGKRFRSFAKEELKSFASRRLADSLYRDFRNGLVHESRLKRGAQFSLGFDRAVIEEEGVVVLNPALLAGEVSVAVDKYVELVENDDKARARLASVLAADFELEL